MSNTFTTLIVQCPSGIADIIMARLSENGFDTFLENPEGFEASSDSGIPDATDVEKILTGYKKRFNISFKWTEVEKINWNIEWERNYEPVIIDDKCIIRADFHKADKHYPYEILINPKMSFGTGHHETTDLMISIQMNIDHVDKRVLDVGSGTGILSIMAEKLGAKEILACDIDSWAVENSLENIKINNCKKIRIYEGTIEAIDQKSEFDIILANINKNVLLDEMNSYVDRTGNNGQMIFSGFLTEDIGKLEKAAMDNGMSIVDQKIQNNWAALVFQKKTA